MDRLKIAYFKSILLILFPFAISAQSEKLAKAKGNTGFVHIYKKVTDKLVLFDSIPKKGFFYCVIDKKTPWYRVFDIYHNEKGEYVCKDSIEIIEYLPRPERRKLILNVFDTQRVFFNSLSDKLQTKQSRQEIREKISKYMLDTYIPISQVFEGYYLEKKDTSMLRQFIETMNSENEIEIGVLTNCFVIDTVSFLKTLKIIDKNKIKGIVSLIDFGLKNMYSSTKKEDAIKLSKYEKKLEAISKELSP